MRKIFQFAAIGLALLFFLAQLIRPDFTNPPVYPNERIDASLTVPVDVAAIIKRSCNDCHSNETVYPWYSRITPINWWLRNHIDEGRKHLNFSTWAKHTREQKQKRIEEICEVVEEGEMPLPSYLWGHPAAVLPRDDSKLLCEWSRASFRSMADPE